jgi:2-keto-4-pentenoate hydratase/2-oxohepta-3-ene-1,7-dioic acid hydratase in catechol pathway
MKLLRYGPKGQEKPGLLDQDGNIRDLSGVVKDIDGKVLSDLSAIRAAKVESLPIVDKGVRIAEPVAKVGKFLCIGLNYSDHAKESNMPEPAEPIIFMKATSAIIGPNDDVYLPPAAKKGDWEVELGIVIGKEARYVTKEKALDYVAGAVVVNDLSEREFQLERLGTWDKGKGCDTFGPFGPYLVTLDEVGDLNNLGLWLDLNGKRVQTGSTASLIFDVPTLVSYVSQFMSLQPGDVISTGTPPGVGLGQKPPKYLVAGQVMRLGIAGLGEQRQRTVQA